MKTRNWLLTFAAAALLWTPTAARAQTLTNGGFESGFAGWTRLDQIGSDGSFLIQSGTSSPINGLPVPAPPEGVQAAMTDAQGPGSHVLYQDFTVPVGPTSTRLGFSLALNSGAEFVTPGTLDFATPALNQQARVDILTAASNPFSVSGGDVLQNLYQTAPGDPLVSGYTDFLVDLTTLMQAHQGQTLRLRFAAVDNVNIFNFGVDNVRFQATDTSNAVPEPGALGLAVSAFLPFLGLLRRRARLGR